MENSHKRKNYFHSKGSQGRYILSYFLIAGIFTLIFTLVFVFFVYDSLSITYDNYNLRVGRTPAIFFERFLKTYGLLIFLAGLRSFSLRRELPTEPPARSIKLNRPLTR